MRAGFGVDNPDTSPKRKRGRDAPRHNYRCVLTYVSGQCKSLLAISIILLAWQPLHADDVTIRPPQLKGVDFLNRLNEQAPLDVELVDEQNQPAPLGQYFHDKPVILVMAYYRCPMLCTLVLNGLVQGLREVSLDMGKDFEVVTVSFDPRETPELAAAKKRTYVGRYDRPGAEQGWHFLTGQAPQIRRLADAIGFRYRYDAASDQYVHPAGIVMLTPGGRIARYFFDVRFSPRDLRLGLVESSAGKVGTLFDKATLFCFHYDPSVGRYGLAVMSFVRAGGVLTMLILGGFIYVQFRRERRMRASIANTPAWAKAHATDAQRPAFPSPTTPSP